MKHLLSFIFILLPFVLQAQNVLDGIEYLYESQISVSNHKTPLWLNANKYGLSSLDKSNGYVRALVKRDISRDADRKIGFGYGVDFVLPYNYQTTIAIQQLYAEVRYKRMTLSLGSKCRPMKLKNQSLSSGSQALGINARPVPQLRLALDDYYSLPFTRGWLAVKGHFAYGYMTDGRWQKDFAAESMKWTDGALYHSKAGYLKIGKEERPVSFEIGLEMATVFGGTVHWYDEKQREQVTFKGGHGLSDFFHAFIPGGSDFQEDEKGYVNVEGNMLGSWVASLTYDHEAFSIALYADHFFEDQSALYHLGTYGYGEDGDWQKRNHKLYLYPLKDGMLGLEVALKKQDFLKNIVLEFINTRYQSGPIYHDHTPNIHDQIGGMDNYYNHQFYPGWQYYGQVMGNPLYLSPIYNNGELEIKNNRFFAWHFGFLGSVSERFHYRFLGTWQKGLGTYRQPFSVARENVSLLLETEYALPCIKGVSLKAAFGMDHGKLLGNNNGVQLSVFYSR